MQVQINQNTLELVEGDITEQDVSAIVNAANQTLLGGGGVDGAIHIAAGPKLLDECEKLPQFRPRKRCKTGEAKITGGYELKADYVIHTVGPVYSGGSSGEAEQLRDCYWNSLLLAGEHKIKTVACPSISTGVYRYPVKEAASIALNTAWKYLETHPDMQLVRMVLFGPGAFRVYKSTLEDLLREKKIS